jgi:phosphotransferase system, enzyme I, PtsP
VGRSTMMRDPYVGPSLMISESATHESSLLLTLEEISRLVSHSHDPAETLANIVALIQGRFHTDVCSVYLLEPDRGELVLTATLGLDPGGVGRVRLRLDEGLTGLVAERMSPVMVDDAPRHPRFKYVPEAHEDPYHSFLGVPLIEAGGLEGVLVVQTAEPRSFSSDEIRMLLTVGSQLAPLISGARVLGQVVAVAHEQSAAAFREEIGKPSVLEGVSLSPGAGLGRAYIADDLTEEPAALDATPTDPAQERTRLSQAVEAARDEITRLSRRISELVGESHGAILQAQLMILQDRTIEQDLNGALSNGRSAEAALTQTLAKYVAAFQRLTNPFFQERVYDVKDVFRRVLRQLRPGSAPSDIGGDRVVLVASEASVLDLLSVEPDRLAAVVVAHGGPQSHAAILARSLGIPMVGHVHDLLAHVRSDQLLRIDGSTGVVDLNPAIVESRTVNAVFNVPSSEPCSIENGSDIRNRPRVEANINLLYEVEEAVAQRASGVGLYRTEFLFLARRTMPTEEEQVGVYRRMLSSLAGRPASIRTFDLRPDKLGHYAHVTEATAHLFDWRRVLESPPLRGLFKDQVRAILRASVVGPARILVPNVTRTEQLDFVLETVANARQDLDREGLGHGQDVPLGIMIEAAAAVPMVGLWAPRVDFLAIGTNDLVASALGIERDDTITSGSNDPLHPGLLRLVHQVISSAHDAGRTVSVCGELAADPEGMMALYALGIDTLSVAVKKLAMTRQSLLGRCGSELTALAPRLLELATAAEVRSMLSRCVSRA